MDAGMLQSKTVVEVDAALQTALSGGQRLGKILDRFLR
jgi:hypothetical protein